MDKLQNGRIILSDALSAIKSLPDNSVDLFFTSPPYADKRKNVYDSIPEDRYIKWFLPIAKEINRVMKPSGSFFLNIKPHSNKGQRSLYVMKLVIALVEQLNFQLIDEYCWVKMPYPVLGVNKFKNAFEPIYHFSKENPTKIKFNPLACGTPLKESSRKRANRKNNAAPKSGSNMVILDRKSTGNIELVRPSNVLVLNNIINQSSRRQHHPASFPDELPEFFIKSFTNEGDLVVDPFAGSGTTGVVSKELKRDFIIIDNKESYYNMMLHNINL